jgi:hypothetical protein
MTGKRADITAALTERIAAFSWDALTAQLTTAGWANAGALLSYDECARLIAEYDSDLSFRSRVVMERHNFGLGDYAYFAEPLPLIISVLRAALYPRLAPISNDWAETLTRPERYPANLDDYVDQCSEAGQTKSTSLLLRYREGGFNCLHRDLYGELYFPIQAMVMLSEPGSDFEGGEFLLVENRARQQSRGTALTPRRGELVLFAGNERPVRGKRGFLRASMRHGVSIVSSGERFTLGIIFHNAS